MPYLVSNKIEELFERVLVDAGTLVGLLFDHVEDEGDQRVVVVEAENLLSILGQFAVSLFGADFPCEILTLLVDGLHSDFV
jgi:hypothetical protein